MSAELVEQGLAASRSAGCVVALEEQSQLNLRWATSSLTTNGAMTERSATVIATTAAGAVGVRSASVTTAQDVVRLVAAADAAAAEAEPAHDAAPLVGGDAQGDFSDPAPGLSPGELGSTAQRLGAAFTEASGRGRSLYGFAEQVSATTWLGTSAGLRRRHTQPRASIDLTAKATVSMAEQGAGSAASLWAGRAGRQLADVDLGAMIASVQQGLDWSRRRVDLPAGRYQVLLPPSAVADLAFYAYLSASARDAEEGRSVYSRAGGTRVGEAIGPPGLALRSDPAEPGLEVMPFLRADSSDSTQSVFDNGQPLTATRWLDDGRLATLVHTRAGAQKSGAAVTPLVGNLVLDGGGQASLTEMVASTERALLLTCLWYIRVVDPQTLLLTGLTRDGVFLVENGEVVGAVNNFRFNESPIGLLGRIQEVGATEPTLGREFGEWFPFVSMPPLRVADFNMSSVSKAS